MPTISILGAQGTGKTVLLTALGQKCLSPSPKGYFMEPVNREASDFIFKNWKLLSDAHKFPPPTPPGQLSRLHFKLHLGSSVYDLNMVDFAGETFRDVFSRNEFSQPQQKELIDHVLASDYVLLLINLKDVVNRGDGDKIMENVWLSKSPLDFVSKNSNGKKIAIVFTQIDRYREYLKECGSWREVLRKYLPSTYGAYRNIPVLAVSSVNKIELDDAGHIKPAMTFEQEGLDDMLEWIAKNSKLKGLYDSIKAMVGMILLVAVITSVSFVSCHIAHKKKVNSYLNILSQCEGAIAQFQKNSSLDNYRTAVNKLNDLLEYRNKNIKTPLREDDMLGPDTKAEDLRRCINSYTWKAKEQNYQVTGIDVNTSSKLMDLTSNNDPYLIVKKNGYQVLHTQTNNDRNSVSVGTDISFNPGDKLSISAYDEDPIAAEYIDGITYDFPSSNSLQDIDPMTFNPSYDTVLKGPDNSLVKWSIRIKINLTPHAYFNFGQNKP